MKPCVLIVDDDEAKIGALSRLIQEAGVRSDCIDTALSAAEARRKLQTRYYDLLILDVLLPARSGGRPSGDVSVDFLRQIVEDGTLRAPSHIVGITANRDALHQHESVFRRMVTLILPTDERESDWQFSLKSLVEKLSRDGEAQSAYELDLCVVAALRKPELAAVLEQWPAEWDPEEFLEKGVVVRRGNLKVGGKTWRVACAHAMQAGSIATLHTAQSLIRNFRPRMLVMTGMCGGVDPKNHIGDVVVAQKSWDWQSGKWTAHDGFLCEPDQKEASSDLVAAASSIDVSSGYEAYKGVKPPKAPRVVVGPILSGSAVVADDQTRATLQLQHRKAAGVDMECYGLYYAAYVGDPAPKALCIKSLSDLANEQKSDDYQDFCSFISASAMYETLVRWQDMASQ